jgi:hypothetical protein
MSAGCTTTGGSTAWTHLNRKQAGQQAENDTETHDKTHFSLQEYFSGDLARDRPRQNIFKLPGAGARLRGNKSCNMHFLSELFGTEKLYRLRIPASLTELFA